MSLPNNSFFQHKTDKVINNTVIWCIFMIIIAVVALLVSSGKSNAVEKIGIFVAGCSLLSLFSMVVAYSFIDGDVHKDKLNEISKITDKTSRINALKDFKNKLNVIYKDDTGWPWSPPI